MESAPKTTWAAGSDGRTTLLDRKRLEGGKGSAVAEAGRTCNEIALARRGGDVRPGGKNNVAAL